MVVLMNVAFKVNKDNYAHVVEKILGKSAGNFLHIIFITTTYGITIIYILTFSVFTPSILI